MAKSGPGKGREEASFVTVVTDGGAGAGGAGGGARPLRP